ncbi:MAG: DUF3786 domain-containing protein [Nitrospirae bacterium]|nr:DUF3786 domain-containing protein [Nitrospirota bacterium]
MNQIELYKNLPKKNCGKCKQKTCMPFALAVIKGDAELSECQLLEPAEAERLKAMITVTDWREGLILKLRDEIKKIDLGSIAELLGGQMQNGSLVVNCMGRPFTVSADGDVTTHGHITPWVKILLLHYIRNSFNNSIAIKGMPKQTDEKWVSYAELKNGMVKAASFEREGEEPLKEMLDQNLTAVETILKRLGAVTKEGFSTPCAWALHLLPKVPVLILYWPEESEFPSKVKVLFNTYADKYLDVEAIVFLIEGLVKNIEAMSRR